MTASRRIALISVSYIVTTAVALTLYRWPNFEGHAHIPFSGFPEFLVWSPLAPALFVLDFPNSATAAAVFAILFGAALWLIFRRR